MKTVPTDKMNPENKQKFIGNILGGFGNDNIRNSHIKYFEEQLIRHNEHRQNEISSAPNYYAWLCLNTENIFWLMRNFCYKCNSFTEEDDLLMMYNNLITKFCETCNNLNKYTDDEIESFYIKAVKLLEVRHAIIHKGFPNLLPVVFENRPVRNKPMTADGNKVKFTEESTREAVQWFSDPINFSEIKKEFESLINATCLGENRTMGQAHCY